MAVSLVVLQFIQQRRLGAAGAVAVNAHAQGHLVRPGKFHPKALPGEQIRVLPEPLQGLGPIDPMGLHRQMHRQVIPGHKLHGPPQARQFPKCLG